MTPGTFAWRELITPNPASVADFYRDVFGWTSDTMDMGGSPYHLWKLSPDAPGIAGAMPPQMGGVPPFWLDYLRVEDVEASLAVAVTHGAEPLSPVIDAPVGRFALIQDPAGAVLALFQQANVMEDPEGEAPPGTFCWSELHTPDLPGAESFYGAVFGWSASSIAGPRRLFSAGDKGRATVLPTEGRARWLKYVAVDDVAASYQRVLSAGGAPIQGPTSIPGLGELAVFADPSGAALALWKTPS